MNRLAQEGMLIFSTNYRKFQLDSQLEEEFLVKEITDQTLPEDFQGKGMHRCWQLRRQSEEE